MADVFISYKREELARAVQVASALEQEGYSTFYDVGDGGIQAGETWDKRLERELAQAKCCVVLWSAASTHSDNVRDEARRANERGILVPAFIEGCQPPLGLGTLQAANLKTWRGDRTDPQWRFLIDRGVAVKVGQAAKPMQFGTMLDAEARRESNAKKVMISQESRHAFGSSPEETPKVSKASNGYEKLFMSYVAFKRTLSNAQWCFVAASILYVLVLSNSIYYGVLNVVSFVGVICLIATFFGGSVEMLRATARMRSLAIGFSIVVFCLFVPTMIYLMFAWSLNALSGSNLATNLLLMSLWMAGSLGLVWFVARLILQRSEIVQRLRSISRAG